MQGVRAIVVVGICCLPVLGCSENTVVLGQVMGQVTFNGKPIVAEIIFEPVDADGKTSAGRPSTGYSNEQGEYTMNYSANHRGAQVGLHHVTINIINLPKTNSEQFSKQTGQRSKTIHIFRKVQRGNNHYPFAITL